MVRIKEKLVKSALQYIQNSQAIEEELINSYDYKAFTVETAKQYKKSRPFVNDNLYEKIFELKRLPSVSEFLTFFKGRHVLRRSDEIQEEIVLNHSYLSLVRDIHFYFILKESNLFDEVVIHPDYDTQAATDILVRKGNLAIGLQLFSGNEEYEEQKKEQIEKKQKKLGYVLIPYSLKKNIPLRKKLVTKGNFKFHLYSKQDAEYILELLEETVPLNRPASFFIGNATTSQFVLADSKPKEINHSQDELTSYIDRAKHSILLVGNVRNAEKLEKQIKRRGLVYYHCKLSEEELKIYGINKFVVVDGKMTQQKFINFLKNNSKKYNFDFGQYSVEHSTIAKNSMVTAGAGSGKTRTLTSRVLYLLHTGKIDDLSQISMITFTNESADNMRNALAKRLKTYFKDTQDIRYRKHLEDLNRMQIMTIPAFAKYILKEFGHYIGLGNQINISELTMQRREILEKHLNKNRIKLDYSMKDFNDLQYYQLLAFAEKVWEKLEQKAVTRQQLMYAVPDQSNFVKLINQTIIDAEEEFEELKFKLNTLTVSDLTTYLNQLTENQNVPLGILKEKIRFLFVDEFQDSDNAQIYFISALVAASNIQLMVVGDIKQSIYRFRGANSTAFEMLSKRLMALTNKKPIKYNLEYNYRTSEVLFNKNENIFKKWRDKKYLPQEISITKSYQLSAYTENEAFKNLSAEFNPNGILDLFNTMRYPKSATHERKVLAVLARGNSEVEEAGRILNSFEGMPPVLVTLEGSLFKSNAARDLLILLESWLKPNLEISKYSMSQTAFVKNESSNPEIEYGLEFIKVPKTYEFEMPLAWYQCQEYLKYTPTYLVINEFIARVNYQENLRANNYEEHQILQYELNLYKILSILYAQISDSEAGLLTIYKWLSIQVATNRNEDEAEISDEEMSKDFIRVMTVHKSKGLEFHTVVLPFGNKTVMIGESKDINDIKKLKNTMDVVVDTENHLSYGWHFCVKKSKYSLAFQHYTENYKALNKWESGESLKEETRVLYVAMTRAQQRLVVFKGKRKNWNNNLPSTWNDLLD